MKASLTLCKKIVWAAFVLTLILTASISMPEKTVEAAQQGYSGKIKETVSLKRTKSNGSKTLSRIKKGKKVEVLRTSGKKRKVIFQGKVGYVPKRKVHISTKAPSLKGKSKKEKGKTVVAFAKRFVGNPYVWGGTNLNRGADCSGFVGSVYRAFGYHLPRSSSSLRHAGRKVSYKKKQPGDLICYSGHVAIYIGKGKIVHASSRKTGIKISPRANYRRIVAVRRIVK